MDNELKQECSYNYDFPQHLCKMCGKCCKAITTPYTHEKLVELAKEGQEEAQVFVKVFKRYPSLNDAKKAVPDHVENILNQIKKNNPDFNENDITFYYCPNLTKENKCSIHATRPDCCRRAPRNGWSMFPPECGFKGWQFQQRERVKGLVRKIKEHIVELELLPPETILNNEEITAQEKIDMLNDKMKPWEKYGSDVW